MKNHLRICGPCFLITLLTLSSSCAHLHGGKARQSADAQSEPKVCAVHGITLERMLIPMHTNCTLPDEAYRSARDKTFPYAPDLFLEPHNMSEPIDTYICPRCWYEQQQWLSNKSPRP